MDKRGMTLLLENIIFIILNLVFITILIIFLASKSGDASVLEEKYAKQIALAVDSAKPGMAISLDMTDAIKVAKKNLGENNLNNIVSISGNVVNVKLKDTGGYFYSFFNNAALANCYMNIDEGQYVLFVGGEEGCRK